MDKMHETPDPIPVGGSEYARSDNDRVSVAEAPGVDKPTPEFKRL